MCLTLRCTYNIRSNEIHWAINRSIVRFSAVNQSGVNSINVFLNLLLSQISPLINLYLSSSLILKLLFKLVG